MIENFEHKKIEFNKETQLILLQNEVLFIKLQSIVPKIGQIWMRIRVRMQ